ncbi:MAG: DUF2812 domain-containing protein [Clostridiales bacterium]|nr:DUF2812 domain-containing protein [Clostridiales bacterium]
MAKTGLILSEIKDNTYIFVSSEDKAYEYKIDFLKNGMTKEEITNYLSFLEEMNIEIVYRNMRWVYLRRLSTDSAEPFEIYSDIQSKIDYYKDYNIIKYIFAFIFIFSSLDFYQQTNIVILLNIIKIVFGLICLISALSTQKKILKLTKLQKIHE